MNGWIIAAIATVLFGGGFYLGTLPGEVKFAKAQVVLADQDAKVLREQQAKYTEDMAAKQKVIDQYEKDRDDAALQPISNLAQRVLEQSCGAPTSSPVQVGTVVSGNESTLRVPTSDTEAVRLLQDAFEAGRRDGLRLNAAIKLAP